MSAISEMIDSSLCIAQSRGEGKDPNSFSLREFFFGALIGRPLFQNTIEPWLYFYLFEKLDYSVLK